LDTLSLARLLFAVTAGTHFLFVSLTLGLATLVAIMETRAVAKGDDVRMEMVRFWGQLYVINYAVGIVTGLLMEFQFGLNWPGLTDHARDVFGAPLAMETLVAFFIEATFLGLWIFGWNRVGRRAHVALIWIVTATAYISAYFILVANGFLRHPVGYVRSGGDLRVHSAVKLFTNPAALLPLGHILAGSFLVAGFFMAGISAYHLRRDGDADREFFLRSLRIGLIAVVAAILPTLPFGGLQFAFTPKGQDSVFTDVMAGLMILAWVRMFAVSIVAATKLRSDERLLGGRRFLGLLPTDMIVPYVAMLAGWLFREGGRQPWLIQGVLRTKDAVRPVSHVTMLVALAVTNLLLLGRFGRRGPEAATLGRMEPADSIDPVPSF
jgi:cytochrome bd ubiquinol oxidase subunit I